MASTSETGHAKNVANFQDLITFVTGYGPTYSPTKASLKVAQLNALLTLSQGKLADVISKNTAYNNAVNARVDTFSTLRPLATRLINALEATDATPEKIKDAKTFNHKLNGRRVKAIETPTDPNTPPPNTISVSQQSYDQLIEHFAGLISVLQSEPTYTPNEPDLKLATLNTKKSDMITKNTEVATAYATISNTRIDRDKTLYTTTTSLVNTADDVKKYIKSLYGAASPEYAQVKGILFKKPR